MSLRGAVSRTRETSHVRPGALQALAPGLAENIAKNRESILRRLRPCSRGVHLNDTKTTFAQ